MLNSMPFATQRELKRSLELKHLIEELVKINKEESTTNIF